MVCTCPIPQPCISMCSSSRCTILLSQTLTLSTPLTHACLPAGQHTQHTHSAGPVGWLGSWAVRQLLILRGAVRTVSRARVASAAQSTALEHQPHTALQSLLRNTPPHTPQHTTSHPGSTSCNGSCMCTPAPCAGTTEVSELGVCVEAAISRNVCCSRAGQLAAGGARQHSRQDKPKATRLSGTPTQLDGTRRGCQQKP